jgi:hypothetical protein
MNLGRRPNMPIENFSGIAQSLQANVGVVN